MDSTRFVSLQLSDPARTVQVCPAHVAAIVPSPVGTRVYLAGGASFFGYATEVQPLIEALAAPEVATIEAAPIPAAPEAEPELSADELREVRELLAIMREEEERDLQAAREILEEMNAALLEADWLNGSERPGVAPLRLIVASAPRVAYCEQPGADVKAWKFENGELFGALGKLGLSKDANARHAIASAVLGFEVTSHRVLTPAQLRRVRLAVEAGRVESRFKLRIGIARAA